MGGMTTDEERELRALRARAYGPGADIAGDESALRRLEALESRRRSRSAAPPDSPGVAESDGAPRAHRDRGDRAIVPPGPGPGPARRGLSRPLLWAWSGSLAVATVAAAVVASVATAAFAPPASMVPGARHEATLAIDETFSWPGMFEGGMGRFYTAYAGYVPIATTIFGPEECLMLYRADAIDPDSDTYRGDSSYGCGAGGFPPSVVVSVGAETSGEPGVDRALQFVLNGSVVEVYADGDSDTVSR